MDRSGLRLKLFKAQAEAGDIVLLFADESEALTHPYLARLGQEGRGPSGPSARTGAKDRDDGLARLRPAQVDRHDVPDQAELRFHRTFADARPPLRPQTWCADEAGGPCPRQWSHPRQQGQPGGAGRTRALAHRRMVAQIRPRVERHRNRLGRPEGAPPCASNLHRSRQPRGGRPPRRHGLEFGPKLQSVG